MICGTRAAAYDTFERGCVCVSSTLPMGVEPNETFARTAVSGN
jgi:hypothetical protein